MNNFLIFIYLNSEIVTFFIINVFIIIYFIERLIFNSKELDIKYIYLLSILFILLLYLLYSNSPNEVSSIYYLNNYFIYNNFIVFIKEFMIFILLLYFIYYYNYNNIIKLPFFEYIILILISFFALQIIIISNNLFIIFLFIELVNLCIYCLIGLNKYSNIGIECAYKYFIQSAFSTIIGFFALSLLYNSCGTLFINELGLLISNNNWNIISILGIYLLILSIFFKLGLFPLHSWIADVYQGSFLVTVLFIATLPKIAYIYLFLKIFIQFYSLIKSFCLIISFITIIYGSLISLYQTSLKRLIGYGSMVHVGFIIYSISLYSIESCTASFFYLFFYILLTFFIFTFMLLLYDSDNNNKLYFIDNISQLNIILNRNKLLAFMFAFILLSLAGLPFFIGFISKWYIFLSLINKGSYIELFILLIVSIISAAYYIRILRFLFFLNNKNLKIKTFLNLKYSESLLIYLILLFILNMLIIILHPWIYLLIFKNLIFIIF